MVQDSISENSYYVHTTCHNCLKPNIIWIPYGITVNNFLKKNHKCGNCGCDIRSKY